MFVVCVYRPLTNSSFVSICVLFFLRFLYFLLCFIYFGKQCQSLSTFYRSNSICIHEMCASIGHIFSAIFRVCCMAATSVVKFRVFFFLFFAAIRRHVAMADRLFLSMLLLLFSHSPRTRNLVGGYFFNIKSLEFDGRDPCIFLNFLRLCVCRFIFILTTNDLSKWFMIGNVVGVGNILYPKHVPI